MGGIIKKPVKCARESTGGFAEPTKIHFFGGREGMPVKKYLYIVLVIILAGAFPGGEKAGGPV